MGWKLAVAITCLEGRSLQEVIDQVYGSPQRLAPTQTIADEALYPPRLRSRYALEHDGFAWLFDWKLVENSFKKPLCVSFPVSVFFLHSVVGGYGFMHQAAGKYRRCVSGDTDHGSHVEIGEPTEIERTLLESRSGYKSVVFGLMKHLVGFRLDEESPAVIRFVNAKVLKVESERVDWRYFLGDLSEYLIIGLLFVLLGTIAIMLLPMLNTALREIFELLR